MLDATQLVGLSGVGRHVAEGRLPSQQAMESS